MGTTKSEAKRQGEFAASAEAIYVRLWAWRGAHLDAIFDEVGDQVTQEQR